ncbi:MAG: carbohydrate kinase [Nitriliruptorales bacterium]|nr:carbohydrate kinase [Nitriliruptorales bacterium]
MPEQDVRGSEPPASAGTGEPTTPVVIGLDLGTTRAQAIAYDADGRHWASAGRGYPLSAAQPGWSEQDPDQVADAAMDALADAARVAAARGARVVAVSLSATLHSLIGLDRRGRALTPSLTLADRRAVMQADRLRQEHDAMALYRRTGTPVHPMAPLAKLMWFRERQAETAEQVRHWVSIKEYLLRRLGVADVVDHSLASATGLFNLADLDWDSEALGLAGIDRDQLSRPVPTEHRLGSLPAPILEGLGLEPGTPFVIGAGDGALANLGAGAIAPGVAAATVGASGAVRLVVTEPRTDPLGRTFCYVLTSGRWVIGGASNNGELVLRWLRAELFPDVGRQAVQEGADAAERLIGLAAAVPPGAAGLLCLPYLAGERAPRWTSVPGGVLFGLRREHTRGHVVRAAMEGVMLQLAIVVQALEESGTPPRRFRATGGFLRSRLWRQIMADVFDRDIAIPGSAEGSTLGAALLGLRRLDLIASLDVARDLVPIAEVVRPQPKAASAYRRLRGLYGRLSEALDPEFDELTALRAELLEYGDSGDSGDGGGLER